MSHCAKAELVHDTRDSPYTYKGESTTIPGVMGEFCPACRELILDAAEAARTNAMMLDFNKQVDASIVDPEFIVSVRKKLALDQREATEILGRRQCFFPLREREDQAATGPCQAT